ncbi:MAG: Uma2 family endonuclease [Saprospiraceae bacterium]
MVATAEKTRLYTHEEYLKMEERASEKHQFFNGKIIPLAGGTVNHNEFSAITITALTNIARAIRNPKFRVYTSDMKIRIPRRNTVVYPDALAIAEKPEFFEDRRDIITNPLLIVEVVSPSSEVVDRGAKFYDYRTLPSFREYLLVYQDEPLVAHAVRQGDDLWKMTDVRGLEAVLELATLGCSLRLSDIYYDIEFEAPQYEIN